MNKSNFGTALLVASLSFCLCPAITATASDTSPGKLRPDIQPLVDQHRLAGAVMLVANADKVLDVEAVGLTDIGARTPMKPDALFWIASQTKPMTATAFMMLVDEGKVNLEDPVEKYLPEFKGQMVAVEQDADHVLLRRPDHPIKIREILSHTSGLPFSSPMEQPTLDRLPLRDAVRSYAMSPLKFQPGTKFLYSNAGLNTAARILEVVSGMPYEKFLADRLLKPLGMTDTTFWPTPRQLKRLAKSYALDTNLFTLTDTTVTQLQYPLSDSTRHPMPAGGLFSTAHDVGRFCQMIMNDGTLDGKRYLSAASVRLMTSKETGAAVASEYGFGWSAGKTKIGHGGAYSTDMTIDREHGLIMVWLVQQTGSPIGHENVDLFQAAALKSFAGTP